MGRTWQVVTGAAGAREKQFESEKWRAVREIEPLFDFVFFLRKNADLRRKTPMALS